MNKEKIAILIDSCTDVPVYLVKKYDMYVLQLKIIYKDKVYTDGVDITAQDVYDKLSVEIPKTSLPSGGDVSVMLDKIKADGYERVLAVTISSGLSGTYNVVKLIADKYTGLDVHVVDTKNIGLGSGFSAVQAGEYINQGMSWSELKQKTEDNVKNSRVFFCISTLEYLQKGGRIGLVASILGSALNLKPIISCNEDGIYYNIAKVIGRKQSIKKVMELAVDFAGKDRKYNLALVHGDAEKEADEIKDKLLSLLPNHEIFAEGQISPALGVHTGPGLIGIIVQLL